MSGGSRRKRKGNKAWDDVINASSAQDGNPFDLLKMELPDEQREIYKKMRGEVMRMMGAGRETESDRETETDRQRHRDRQTDRDRQTKKERKETRKKERKSES